VRRQPVTNLTLNQLTCARPHKRAPVHASARSRALDAGYLLVICVTLCIRCLSLTLSLSLSDTLRRRRPAYADPLNKLARAASGEDIRSKEKEEERVSPPRDETAEKSIRAISRMLRWQPRAETRRAIDIAGLRLGSRSAAFPSSTRARSFSGLSRANMPMRQRPRDDRAWQDAPASLFERRSRSDKRRGARAGQRTVMVRSDLSISCSACLIDFGQKDCRVRIHA